MIELQKSENTPGDGSKFHEKHQLYLFAVISCRNLYRMTTLFVNC